MTSEGDAADGTEPSEQATGERSDPGAAGDGVPLDITGHEERKREREGGDGAAGVFGDDAGGAESEGEAGSDDGEGDGVDTESLLADAPADPEPNPEDDEVEPVELLVQLAKRGDIEPWDIDIVAVTDEFLAALDEADLRTSGRALFYASVLLRMKSDAMLEDDDDDDDEDAEAEDPERAPWEPPPPGEDGEQPAYDPVSALEAEMDRRLERKHARGSPQTLDELVRELREAERGSWWKESREYDTSDSPQGFRRGVQELDYHSGDEFRMDDEPTAEEALGNAHEEDIEATIADVEDVLDDQYGSGRTEVLYAEIADAGPSRVETFLALLFLAHRGAVTLEQDDLFGDLWVCDPAAVEEREATPTA